MAQRDVRHDMAASNMKIRYDEFDDVVYTPGFYDHIVKTYKKANSLSSVVLLTSNKIDQIIKDAIQHRMNTPLPNAHQSRLNNATRHSEEQHRLELLEATRHQEAANAGAAAAAHYAVGDLELGGYRAMKLHAQNAARNARSEAAALHTETMNLVAPHEFNESGADDIMREIKDVLKRMATNPMHQIYLKPLIVKAADYIAGVERTAASIAKVQQLKKAMKIALLCLVIYGEAPSARRPAISVHQIIEFTPSQSSEMSWHPIEIAWRAANKLIGYLEPLTSPALDDIRSRSQERGSEGMTTNLFGESSALETRREEKPKTTYRYGGPMPHGGPSGGTHGGSRRKKNRRTKKAKKSKTRKH